MFDNDVSLIGGFNNKPNKTINFYYGIVIDVSVKGDKGLKVRITGVDDKLSDDELPWCASFIPINLVFLTPKAGEMVKIIPQSTEDIYMNREWIGPVITNPLNSDYQSNTTALSNQANSTYKENIDENLLKDYENLYPQDGSVLQGRNNSDIVLGDRSLELRAGKHEVKNKTKRNKKNPASLKIQLDERGVRSDAVLMADKVVISTTPILDPEELERVILEASSASYAEPIITFMRMMQDFVANHIHASNLPPNRGTGSVRDIINFDVESVKANNIKLK